MDLSEPKQKRKAQYSRAYYLAHREKIKAASRQYRLDHAERIREVQRRRYAENKPRALELNKRWHENNPERYVAHQRKCRYGVSAERFKAMLDQQGGLCGICHKPLSPGRGTNIDHDHRCCPGKKSCGKCVRGLLCAKCNLGVHFIELPGFIAPAQAWISQKE